MGGIQEKLADLSWLGEAYADQGWVQVEGEIAAEPTSTPSEIEWERAKGLLRDSDWTMLSDVPLTIAYRKALREVRSQNGFPDNIIWPNKPE
jgi:hypothetical protein